MGRMGIKDRIYDLWNFYKWFIMAFVVLFFLLVYFLYNHFNQKEPYLNIMLIDCHSAVTEEQIVSDYEAVIPDFDEKKYEVTIQTSLMIDSSDYDNYEFTCLARFLADIGSQKLDVCGMTEDNFKKYATSGTWLDLRQVLSDEEIEDLADCLYIDSDCRVVGIYTKGMPGLDRYGCYETVPGVIGIAYNTTRLDAATAYIKYLVGITN